MDVTVCSCGQLGARDDAFPWFAEPHMAFLGQKTQLFGGLVDRFGAAGIVGEHSHRIRRQGCRGSEHGGRLAKLSRMRFEAGLLELANFHFLVNTLVVRHHQCLVQQHLPFWNEVAVCIGED